MKCSKIILTLQAAAIIWLFAFVAPATAQSNLGQNVATSQASRAHSAAASTLTGNWKRQETAQQKASRFKAIDQVTSKMGRFKRSRAQEKLRAATALKESLSIVDAGNNVTLGPTVGQRINVTTDGKVTKLNGPKNSGTVKAARKNGRLVVQVDSGAVSRTTVYTLSRDKTRMTLDVSVSNPNLPQSIRFQMTFVRTAAVAPAANARSTSAAARR